MTYSCVGNGLEPSENVSTMACPDLRIKERLPGEKTPEGVAMFPHRDHDSTGRSGSSSTQRLYIYIDI